MKFSLVFLLTWLTLTAQAQKMAVPYYSAGQVKFYDLAGNPATLLGTLNTTISGTTYKPNGITFYGTDMLVTYDEPTSDGFLHYKGVQVSGGTVTYTSVVKVITSTVTTEIVVDASGNLYVGCGFGGLRGVKKFIRDGSGNYSTSTNLTMPSVTSSQWYSGIAGLAFDATGNLFATDLSDNRILKWTGGAGSPVEFKCASPVNCQLTNTASQSVYLFSLPEGLVFDAGGNLWIGNNNDSYGATPNSTGGSLVKLSASLLSGAGGTITSANALIYSTNSAKFGGMVKVGTDYYVNDQGNSKVWKLNTSTGALTDIGIAVTYPGNGQLADVPAAVFSAVALSNPTVTPASATITSGQSVALTASNCAPGNTYLWNTGETSTSITKSPITTTTYVAYCKNGANQSSGTSVVVTVNPGSAVSPPVISASSTVICFGGSAVLSATGCTGGTITWSNGQTGASLTLTGVGVAGDYTATCTLNSVTSGNSNTIAISTDPNPQPQPPTLSSSASGAVTPGTSVTLTASGCSSSLNIMWSNGLGSGYTKVVTPLQSTTYTATCSYAPCVSSPSAIVVQISTSSVDEHIKTDQFGYLPSAQKIAVISSPDPAVSQYNQNSSFTPSGTYQLRRLADDVVVFTGAPVAWNSGATHSQSGDKVWWFDFSSVTTPGSYYVFDVGNSKRSYPFDISESVYDAPSQQALRALAIQRCGIVRHGQLGNKIWHDNACHVGNLQDTHCRDVSDPTNVSKERDMSGGWHDAGDFNKYSLYASEALHNLLKAYEENPAAWTAVSGELPAPLAVAQYELDWLLKMQDTDGGVRCKVSIKGYGASSPPSSDTRQRFYGGRSTLTTLAVASVLAHAASVFSSFSATYSNTLKTAAQTAWNWAIANPNVIFDNSPFLINGGGSYNPDDGIYGDASTNYYRSVSYKTVAAAYLFNLYGTMAGATYKTAFENLYASTNQMTWTAGSDTYFPDWQVVLDALLTYADNAGATTSHATAIRNKFTALVTTSVKLLPAYTANTDAYRAYLNFHSWNSNQQKAQAAIQMQMLRTRNLSPTNNTALQNASLGYLNYLHGLNPNAKCYLSQMNTLGADNSQNEIYHGWFWDGTAYDNALTSSVGPFPGFLIGGPNQSYSGTVNPPAGQPAQKSYKDWNTDYPDNSYEITEIGIYTQAAYIRLASRYRSTGCALVSGTAISAQSGDWALPSTWVCGSVPTATSTVQIKTGHVVTITTLVQAKSVQFEGSAGVVYNAAGRLVLNP